MRTPRNRLAQPHLTGGMDADAAWQAAPCMAEPQLFEYERHGESLKERRARHKVAKAACYDCPALALCLRTDHGMAEGVIAGRVVKR